MHVYGELIKADLENLASNPSVSSAGRIFWDTVLTKAKIDDGTNVRALLRNDQYCVFGNNGTANSNIRLQRGAAAVLQFVLGGDTTAEGTLSTSLAQISAKMENYATGSLPSAANAGRIVFDTTVTSPKFDTGAAWITLSPLTTRGDLFYRAASDNSRLAIGSANTILKTDGTDPAWAQIVDAYVSSSAAITRSKLASGTNYRILANSSAGVMSENAALTAAHVIFADANGQLSGEAQLSISRGGTGQATATAAFNALHPMTTTGDTIYSSSGTTAARLGIGSANQVLQTINGLPSWQTVNFAGKNYIAANPDAEVDTSGWVTYADAAQNTPVDATGGSPSSTWTRVTSSPLRGSAAFLWTRTAANRQGEGVAFAFTIDNADQAKPLAITFDYKNVSGTFFAADGITTPLNDGTTSVNAGMSDLEVFIYDVTNSVLIPVSPQVITSASTGAFNFKGTFQTASNSTSYRLVIHTARSTAVAFTQQFDNFFVGPQSVSYGAAIGDWTTFTPTGTWNTNVTYTGKWRRVGDSMQCQVFIALSGAPNATGLGVNLPSGYSIDTTKIVSTGANQPYLGTASVLHSGVTWYVPAQVGYTSATQVSVFSPTGSTANQASQITATNPATFANNDVVQIEFTVPISGWSSTVLMSNDTDTRVVAAIITGDPASATSGNPIIVPTVGYDSHGAYNASTGRYTCPVSGLYKIFGALQSASSATTLTIYKNASSTSLAGNLDSNGEATFASMVNCVAGDIIDLRPGGTVDATNMTLNIERLSGPAAIAATDSVSALYTGQPTGSLGASFNIATIPTKTKDTHNAYSSGTYTVPVSGTYSISAQLSYTHASVAASNYAAVSIFINGVEKHDGYVLVGGTAPTAILPNVSVHGVPLIAGDLVTIRSNSSGTTPAFAAAATQSYFSIVRTGNY